MVFRFFRKLKRDLQAELTEASIPGAALSVVAAVVMLGLIFAELNSFLTIASGASLWKQSPMSMMTLQSSVVGPVTIESNTIRIQSQR